MKSNYRDGSMCTYGTCCQDDRCERWTLRVAVITVVFFVVLGIVAVVEAF